MKKSILFKLAVISMAVLIMSFFLAGQAYAKDTLLYEGEVTDIYGVPSGTLRYAIYDDGTMVITGNGPGASYRPFGLTYDEKCPWKDYRPLIKKVIFECVIEGTAIPSIGGGGSINGWFIGCENLEWVSSVPNGITDMSAAFYGCIRLKYVENIPDTVKTLQYTFWDCIGLSVAPRLPSSLEDDLLTEFEDYDIQFSQGLLGTFHGCTGLLEAPVIPDNPNLYKLVNTFEGCTSLKIIKEIPQNITYFQASFKNCRNLTGAMYIRADDVRFVNGVFDYAACENQYIYFIKSDSEKVSEAVLAAINESSRVYAWNGNFGINFMVMNSVNNADYGIFGRKVNLRYGCDFQNSVIDEYRSFIYENFGDYYNTEFLSQSEFAVPDAGQYSFRGWYADASFENMIKADMLIVPTNRQLAAGEINLYAKMEYNGSGCILTINPNGGEYKGSSGITMISEFEDKSFLKEFSYTGNCQQYKVPVTGMYTIELYGAQGGGYGYRTGGFGGSISVLGKLNMGDDLYVFVGGGGQSSDGEYAKGGFNGGGDSVRGYLYMYYDDEIEDNVLYYDCCGGGGGATDVRLGNTDILSRIATAGGGGGAGRHNYWYCMSDNPELPNVYYDDDDDEYFVYNRTVSDWKGQGGNSAAGGGGGVCGGAHNYEGEGKYGKANSSYSGTNGCDDSIFTVASSSYHVWGDADCSYTGRDGYVKLTFSGVGYEPEIPKRDGYVFGGWELEGEAAIVGEVVFMSSKSAILTAKWIPVDYYINFNPAGGYTDITELRFWKGLEYGCFGEFPMAFKDGYDFTGWYTQPDGGVKITEGMIADKDESFTLYAHYEKIYYLINFNPNGGVVGEQSRMVQAYGNYGELPVPVRTGYRFICWENETGPVYADTVMTLLKDHTLTAVWEKIAPPVIEGNSGDGGWRNTPLIADYVISSEKLKELTGIVVSVEIDGEEKEVLNESFIYPYIEKYSLHMVIGDVEEKQYEGISRWKISAYDSCGNVSYKEFTVKLDYTPPVISSSPYEIFMLDKEYINDRRIIQCANDTLSGIKEFYLTPGSMQGTITDSVMTPYLTNAPFIIDYDADITQLKNEAGYVLRAEDMAGNVSEKIIFTENSVRNTILRIVPRENYD